MTSKVSSRCGKSTCEFYEVYNAKSHCEIYDDRNKCSLSLKQRKKTANKSRNSNN